MSVKIGHASIDENGNVANGEIGDQTKKEVCVRQWYSKPWNVYLECTDKNIAYEAASYMEKFCANDNIGYDQNHRLTMYNSIVAHNYNVALAKGEADCSSAVSAAYILAGLNISPACTTRSLRAVLLATGKFRAYTDNAHLSSDRLVKRGSIHLSEGHHVIMNLENGSGNPVNPFVTPATTVEFGELGVNVRWVQWELCHTGYKVKIDGDFGSKTDKAVRQYQKANGLEVDGKVGTKTREHMLKKG